MLFRWLALIGVVNAAIAAWYYLRVIAAMYLRDSIKPLEPRRAWPGLATVWICAALTLGLGVYPWPLVHAAHRHAGGEMTSPRSSLTPYSPLAA